MLRAWTVALGVLVLVAGCAGPREDPLPAPEEDCLLGGSPRAPVGDRQAFNVTTEHLGEHPNLSRVFSEPSHLVSIQCDAALELMNHLASEGADVADGPREFDQNVYVTHDGVTIWISIQHRQ